MYKDNKIEIPEDNCYNETIESDKILLDKSDNDVLEEILKDIENMSAEELKNTLLEHSYGPIYYMLHPDG